MPVLGHPARRPILAIVLDEERIAVNRSVVLLVLAGHLALPIVPLPHRDSPHPECQNRFVPPESPLVRWPSSGPAGPRGQPPFPLASAIPPPTREPAAAAKTLAADHYTPQAGSKQSGPRKCDPSSLDLPRESGILQESMVAAFRTSR